MRNISDLFKGRDDVHGYYGLLGNADPNRGKRTGQVATRRHPVTAELWQSHLEGVNRLGIVPVMKDATCWWFCIDVDHYQESGLLPLIAARIAKLGLPLVMTKSKSGGCHLWCFLLKPMDAMSARKVAMAWAKRLELPEGHIDFFPIQGDVLDVGNWMNMPYFGKQCHGAGEDGLQDQTLEEFLQYANERITDPDDLKHVAKVKGSAKASARKPKEKKPLPPCIEHYLEDGIQEGGRNNVITHFGVVFKRAYPDDWMEKVQEVNAEQCDPPLPREDMTNILRSVKTREIQYLCNKVREAGGICDKVECKKREFGIKGSGIDTGDFPIDSITKIKGEKPMYKIVTDMGLTMTLDVDQVTEFVKFRKAFWAYADFMLPRMKDDEWGEILNSYAEKMESVEAAPDTQMGERVLAQFKSFAARANTDTLELALTRGLPFYENRTITFRGDDFMQIVDRSLKLEREKTWTYMRDFGCTQVAHGKETLWRYTVPEAVELWFNPYEGDQA